MNWNRRFGTKIIAPALSLLLFAPPAFALVDYSDTARFTQGIQKILTAPFYLPIQIFKHSVSGFPIMGTLNGVLAGTFQTVSMLVSGVFDMAGAVAPYAKYAFPFI